MNRRSFFARTAGLFVAGIAARYLPKGPAPLTYRGIPFMMDPHLPRGAVVMGIDRASYSWWHAQPETDPAKVRAAQEAMDRAMRTLYDECRSGDYLEIRL